MDMKKGIRHFVSKSRKKNHLIMICPTEEENVKAEVKKEIQKMTRKLGHLLEDGISFEIHY